MQSEKSFILIMSGKGGVGKSTIAANLARALSRIKPKVGLLDLDLTGPSIPTMFGLQEARVKSDHGKMVPCCVDNLEIVSIGFLLGDPSDPVIWRGPRKNGMINQFFDLVEWTADTIVVDMPPGTSDEHLSTLKILKDRNLNYRIFIVTAPSLLAVADVRKGINFCTAVGAKVSGIIENFCGVICPCCGEVSQLTDNSAVEKLLADTGLPLVLTLPFIPEAAALTDKGQKSELMLEKFNTLAASV